jgi:3-methyladenine DNA glycosylase Mpg
LIGKVLVHDRRGVRTSGIIVEVGAYIGERSGVSRCQADRANAPCKSAGLRHVYLNYGIHPLVNAVTEAEGS